MKSSRTQWLMRASAFTLAIGLPSLAQAQALPMPTDEECAQIMSDMGIDSPTPGNPGTDAGGGSGDPVQPGTPGEPGTGDPDQPDPVFTGNPVVQPVPPSPTPNPTPTPTPPSTGGGNELSAGQYLRNPDPNNVRVSGRFHVAQLTRGYSMQNLREVKSYPQPRNPAGTSIRTIGGQRMAVKNTEVNKLGGLHSSIVMIIDEINITGRMLGLDAVMTSGQDDRGGSSLHNSGRAIDIRCNTANGYSVNSCLKWAVSLKAALGANYDVMWENYGTNNPSNHIHIEYDPK